ncbi:transducin/WD40 repeat-like superfamily protein [Striga asiatica]|uniref:Transducin/WD40 repeat-like superfamily protein n=1 Tax=Striga asiatica TaxID=4170 RepID=A0A5A7Q6V4_STRAF|nr:transducin/WD40 repeat-like superfamily protein [Striga asiatica]
MASLHKLLSEQGFERQISRKPNKKVKFKSGPQPQDSVTLPIFICHDRRSFGSPSSHKPEKAPPARGTSVISSDTGKTPRKEEPAIDSAAIKAIVSILCGYVGRYSKDEVFRRNIKEKCNLYLENGNPRSSGDEIWAHLEMGIESIDSLIHFQESNKEINLESLQKTIKLLKNAASLGSKSNLSACAHLYLSIVYKFANNEKVSARYLLKLFSDSPYLARTRLLPELWEHVFLPHLLHIKDWRENELGFLTGLGYVDSKRKIEALDKQFDHLMDIGTKKFAVYYIEWLKFGGSNQTPSVVPSVPSPSKSSLSRSRKKSLDSNKSLYQTVFGPVIKSRSMDNVRYSEVERRECSGEEYETHFSLVQKKTSSSRRSSSQSYRLHKPDSKSSDNYFRFLGCRAENSTDSKVHTHHMLMSEKIKNDENAHRPYVNDITTSAISTLCSSESLSECKKAVRLITEAWINSNSHRDGTIIETLLSRASAIQGIMEVLYVSTDDEILELAMSLLAELVSKNETNRLWVLNSDPNLDISIKLFRSSSLFLKAAALLYLIKPKAKQMVSIEWVPLVLRVLEFGDHLEVLFNVKCYTHEAAYYFLNELLTGFNEDKNSENAQQIVLLGGLSLLVRRMDEGDIDEKSKACAVLHCCVKADRICRYYLAKNLNKETIISLLAIGMKKNTNSYYEHALGLMTDLICLSRRNQITECLTGIKKGWDCFNGKQVLLFLLQRARLEDQPVVAVILLQLELMDESHETREYSVYREEAIDAIVKALEYRVFDEKIQELSARALLILGGQFSYTGEPEIERWLLKKADEKLMEKWQQKTAKALVSSGKTRLLAALSYSIASSIPCLARASLVTVCWISISIHSVEDKEIELAACSILVPQLIDCLRDKSTNIEDKILASFSVYNLTKSTDYFSWLSQPKEFLGCLRKLSRTTWTARELISVITMKS